MSESLLPMKSAIPKTLQAKVAAWNKQNRAHQQLGREISAAFTKSAGKAPSKTLKAKITRYKKQTIALTEKKAEIVSAAKRNGLRVRTKQI